MPRLLRRPYLPHLPRGVLLALVLGMASAALAIGCGGQPQAKPAPGQPGEAAGPTSGQSLAEAASPGDENTVVVRLERGDVDAIELVRRGGKCSLLATKIRGGKPTLASAEVPLADCDRVLSLVGPSAGDAGPPTCTSCVSTFVGVTRKAADGGTSDAMFLQREAGADDRLSPLVRALAALAHDHVPSIDLALFR
jgi:hypothetical protein